MSRLETISATLVKRIRRASPSKQRAAALAAATLAVSATNVNHPAVTKSIAFLKAQKKVTARQKNELKSLLSDLDEEYFTLQEAAEDGTASTDDCLKLFSQARAVSAVLFAGSDDPLEAATEAIYEATATSDDPKSILSAVDAALA
ncbi:MAG: hypothetical protein K8T25_06825 [Planctomycetia bacterium]|nr:hypothetical protein [Planctomycetia bacterium]